MSRPVRQKKTIQAKPAIASINGVQPGSAGDVSLAPGDLGIDLTPVTPTDIGAAPYPAGGTDGWALVKSGSGTAWQNVGTAGNLTADALAAGVGLWGDQRVPPKNPTLTSTVTTFQAGHNWTGGTDDTSVKRIGSQSLRIDPTISSSTVTYATSPTLGSTIDLTANGIEILVQLTGSLTDSPLFQVEVSSNGGTNWVATTDPAIRTTYERGRWVTTRLNKNSFGTGTITWTAINKIRIGFRTHTTAAVTQPVYLQRIGVFATTETKASVSIIFEGYSSGYSVMDEFLNVSMKPTVVVRPNNVNTNTANPWTLAQLQEVHNAFGFGVVPVQWSDTEVSTSNYATTNPAEFEAGLLKCLHWFKDNGFERPRVWYASMSGTNNGNDTSFLPYARTYFSGSLVRVNNANNFPVNVYPISNPHFMSGLFLFNGGATMTTQYQQYIDRLVETKSHGFIYAVQLQEAATSGILIGRSDINALLAYIVGKGTAIEVVTANELVTRRF